MGFTYAVLGAGRQGTACAYDLAMHGQAGQVLLTDRWLTTAQAAVEQVDRQVSPDRARGLCLDLTDSRALKFLTGVDAGVSAVTYLLNLFISPAAIQAGAHVYDLGANTDLGWLLC